MYPKGDLPHLEYVDDGIQPPFSRQQVKSSYYDLIGDLSVLFQKLFSWFAL
jgi:hypothetical protein